MKTDEKLPDGEYAYTTGEVAVICRVDPGTVAKWTKAGTLKSHKLPNSTHRRIKESDLIAFMKKFKVTNQTLVKASAYRTFPKDSFVFYKDGSNWCCVRLDFENLQESKAGFGGSLYEAQMDLLTKELD